MQDNIQYHYKDFVLLLEFFGFCCCLFFFFFFKEQRYFKSCIQRLSLTLLAKKKIWSCLIPVIWFSIIEVKDTSTWQACPKKEGKQGWQSCRSYRTRCCNTKSLNQHFSSCFKGSCDQDICSFFPSLLTMQVKYYFFH